ncbi:protein-tyrosine phosphatase-like protein [Aspergillus avenaceus]|uniref:protein-tyrosine-phosphatase n=1 Tax=Aspergillus avenaceus TaxID=36643 RepID=A0A5N6TRD7_ASPAV|nr:protein-tyrosine phosphatase-like protein [Aspergillus avenaceus]
MSAMTGPRSPTSPWMQDSSDLQLAAPSTASILSLCDSRQSTLNPSPSPHNMAPECPGPNYFSISVESPSDTKKNGEMISYTQPTFASPKSQLPTKHALLEDYMDQPKAGSTVDERKASAIYRLSLSRALPKRDSNAERGTTAMNMIMGNTDTVSAERCAELLKFSPKDNMLFDVRPYAHYAKGSIRGSLNLCIPTTLLKRPSFNTHKLANTFTNEADKEDFARWKHCRRIIVYDADTSDMKDAGPLVNVLKKFTAEGWDGEALILRGGFNFFSKQFPGLLRRQQFSETDQSPEKLLPMHIDLPSVAPIAGGCALPDSSRPTIPFFGNIRQHMDLLGGVGQIPIQIPGNLPNWKMRSLPPWLREATNPADKGHKVSEIFLDLEKKELERMKQALTYDASNDTPCASLPEKFRVAGIEKGTKNRYNDIYPFDHSRVKLLGVSSGECDYVNANYMKTEYSSKCYIATQAPVPDTFNDFWRMIWEQDVRLVVSLTAEVERGHVKCHPYWESGTYGPFQVNNFSHKSIHIETPDLPHIDPGSDSNSKYLGPNEGSSGPCIIVRHFGLSHSAFPFQPLREVTQLQYPYWPDFGTTSQPAHLLKLIEQCDKVRTTIPNQEPKGNQQRPVLVHCSAGCGRTGTFCTVDSVLDMLKQRHDAITAHPKVDSASHLEWMDDGNLDLIAKTVADLRTQRPSMVQNLSQFVLCYESVLEWLFSNMEDEQRSRK